MRTRVAPLVLALTACSPTLRASSASAALECGSGLLALSQPAAPDYIRAAGCWLDRFTNASEGPHVEPTEQLGRAVRTAADAVERAQADTEDASAQREAARAVSACARLSR